MATCKDCIHEEACRQMLKIIWNGVNDKYEGCADRCETFKNKADFVEVVRCERCEYKEDCEQYIYIDCCRNDLVFCSCGEPKNDKE